MRSRALVALSAADKMAMVATMFAEQWSLKGGNADQLRLRRELLAFNAEKVKLVVGAYAVAAHARPRATGDIDLWVDAS